MTTYAVYLSATCLLVMILFATYHTVKQHQYNRQQSRKRTNDPSESAKRWYTLLGILNYFVMLVYIFHVIFILSMELYHSLNAIDQNGCKLKWNLLAFSVHFTKFNIYLLFMTQIYCSFMTNLEYGYSLKKFIFLYIYIFIYLIVAAFNDFYYIDGKLINNVCEPQIPFISMLSTLIIDVSLSILSIILFARPLYRLMQASQHQNIANAKLMNLIIKKCVLVFIALFSTMIVVLILFTSSIILLQIDDMINLFCIIIIGNIHSKLYKKTCGRICHKRIAICLSSGNIADRLMVSFEQSKTLKIAEKTMDSSPSPRTNDVTTNDPSTPRPYHLETTSLTMDRINSVSPSTPVSENTQ